MKLALVRSLDAGDPLTQLGPRAFRPEKFLADPPKPDVEVSPGIWRTADGKLETRFEANEAAKWDNAQKRATALRDAHGYYYGGTVTGRVSCKGEALHAMCEAAYAKLLKQYQSEFRDVTDEKFSQKYLNEPPKLSEYEAWLLATAQSRKLQVGETVAIEDIQDGYIVQPDGQYRYSIEARSVTRLA